MREILFRGKRIDNDEWVEGCGIIATENWVSIFTVIDDIDENSSEVNEIEVLPETVGQYTGLTDKNGDKIFDSDVVDILTENEEVGIVTYDEGCFYVKADGFSIDFRNNINGNDLLIIGNIHDNPEILKREFYICRKRG